MLVKRAIEHLGRVATFTLDLEARWQRETETRRVEIADADVILDVQATLAAEPSVVWGHLTSPALRTRWEGPLVIEEISAGGRRGVGTTAQCVTGRLATLEEIVDWQPYDRVVLAPGRADARSGRGNGRSRRGGRRHAAPDPLGLPGGRAGRRRRGETRIRADKEAAYERLATTIARGLPVLTSEPLQGLLPR